MGILAMLSPGICSKATTVEDQLEAVRGDLTMR